MQGSIVPMTSSAETKLKSYWNRPGGKIGTVIGIVLLGLVGWFVMPILAVIAWTTLNVMIAGTACVLLYMALSNRKLRLSVFYMYEILMKKLVGMVIELDPFIIAEDFIKDMLHQRDEVFKQLKILAGQLQKIVTNIQERFDNIKKNKEKLVAAQKNGMSQEFNVISRQIARDQEYIDKLTPLRTVLERLTTYLENIYSNSKYVIEDAQAELQNKKDMYNSVTAGRNAVNSALKFFTGDPEKKLLAEQSMEFLKDDIANKLGDMRQAMEVTSEFMRNIDLENATYELKGLEMLKESNLVSITGQTAQQFPGLGQVDTSKYDNLLS